MLGEPVEGSEDELVPLSWTAVVIIRSDEIAMGLSPNMRSMNHLWGFDTSFVFCSFLSSTVSENPSDISFFCSLAKTISETTAANRPVGQSKTTEQTSGKIKKTHEPSVLSKNSRDFRDAIPAKAPATSKAATVKIVPGHFNTVWVFTTHDRILMSISSAGEAAGEVALLALDLAGVFGLGEDISI